MPSALPSFEARLPVAWAFGQEGETLLYVFFLRFDIDFGNGCISRQKRAIDELPFFCWLRYFRARGAGFRGSYM